MAIVINGSGTVTGLAVGGLPDGTVDAGTLATNSVDSAEIVDGSVDRSKLNTSIADSGNATAITIDASENIGIGVVPESWNTYKALQVSGLGSIYGYTAVANSDFNFANNVYYNGGHKYIIADKATQIRSYLGNLDFQVAPSGTANSAISWTTAMTIENTGDVGLGGDTAGYAERLVVQPGSGYTGYCIATHTTGTSTAYHLRVFNDNGVVGSIRTSGSATSYVTSSDYRLKENVDYDWDATTRLKQLKPARFNFIADDTNTLVDGFIAHEVSSVVPEAIHGVKDAMEDEEYEVTPAVMDGETVVTEAVMGTRSVPDMQGIDQSKLVPLLVKTIQELEARITALEA